MQSKFASFGMLGKHHTEATKRKMRKKALGKNNSQFGIRKFGKDNPFYGKHFSKKAKIKLSNAKKRNWQDPKYVDMIVRTFGTKPNKPELKLNSILQQVLPNEYTLNVKAEIMILGKKIPDFVNVNGQKKVIELYGDYWHRNDDPQDRIDLFKKLGWDTLIIWEKELKEPKRLREKILTFNMVGLPYLPPEKR